jgi:uncharacterized protein YndB with AHSA1/START domain
MMSNIEKNLHIAAPVEKVWAALTDPQAIDGWMVDNTVQVDLRKGGKYALFSGETIGAFTQVEHARVLEYTWRQNSWRKEWADSLVRWELKRGGDGTFVRLVHSNFPNEEERDSHDEGWDAYWLQPMVEWLEANGQG